MSDANIDGLERREFLAMAAVAAGMPAVRAAADTDNRPSGGEERPNILVITTDQQWAGAMSCAGNPYVNTPAMDSLARDGVLFEAAYTSNPICVPARTSYMTGTASHENGVATNMRPNQVTLGVDCLARVFRDHGYDTGYVGKWHIPRAIEDTAWSGLDWHTLTTGKVKDPHIPGACAEFLSRKRDKPFFLVASFVNPHDICEWARRHSGIDDELPNGEIGPPPAPEECPPFRANNAIPAGEPPVVRQHQMDENMHGAYPARNWPLDDPRWRQYLWGYYRMVELVDRYIGQVLAALRENGLEENTLVVFASDHGDGMGSHHWNQKTIFYDEIARVPFIVCWKGHTKAGGRKSRHLVNLGTDLFPTLFDFAGIPSPPQLRGLSAAPAARGLADAPTHPYIVSENNHHSGSGTPTSVHGRMLRSARYKYIRYNEGQPAEQLFDLELDPFETRDLSQGDEAHGVLEAHRRMLDEYIHKTADSFPRFYKA